jgi:tetratricopeptide (TPR) repeat protein
MKYRGTYIPDDSVARDLAVREGAKAYVSGSISRVGGKYAIAVQLISAEAGEALTAARETASDSTDLIAAVGRASRTLRQRLGESLGDLRDMPALADVTTASVPALRKYTEGYRVYLAGDNAGAIRLFEEAVALDSAFANAYYLIANAYESIGEPGRSMAAKQRSMAHADRLPFRERAVSIASDAYGRYDYETAIREYGRLLERYPADVGALNNQALAFNDSRHFSEAASNWQRAIAIDSTIATLYYGLHTALVNQGKLPEASHIFDLIRARFPDNELLPVVAVQRAAAEQKWDEAWRLAVANRDKLRDTIQLVDTYEALAGIAMTQGRLGEAERLWRTQIMLSTRTESYGRRLFGAMQLGLLELRFNKQRARARAIVDSVLALQPLDSILPADRSYEALARFYSETGDVERARALLAAADTNNRALGRLMPAEMEWTRGVIALATGEANVAERELRSAATRHWCTICVLPSLGRAYEATGKRDLALATYREYMATPWLWRYENDAIEVGQVLRRMGELYELAGQRAQADSAWTALLALWRQADGSAAREVEEVRSRVRGR